MGIGFAEDLLVCVALGVDMVSSFQPRSLHSALNSKADCVFPTRTARFGVALTHTGPINLSQWRRVTF